MYLFCLCAHTSSKPLAKFWLYSKQHEHTHTHTLAVFTFEAKRYESLSKYHSLIDWMVWWSRLSRPRRALGNFPDRPKASTRRQRVVLHHRLLSGHYAWKKERRSTKIGLIRHAPIISSSFVEDTHNSIEHNGSRGCLDSAELQAASVCRAVWAGFNEGKHSGHKSEGADLSTYLSCCLHITELRKLCRPGKWFLTWLLMLRHKQVVYNLRNNPGFTIYNAFVYFTTLQMHKIRWEVERGTSLRWLHARFSCFIACLRCSDNSLTRPTLSASDRNWSCRTMKPRRLFSERHLQLYFSQNTKQMGNVSEVN